MMFHICLWTSGSENSGRLADYDPQWAIEAKDYYHPYTNIPCFFLNTARCDAWGLEQAGYIRYIPKRIFEGNDKTKISSKIKEEAINGVGKRCKELSGIMDWKYLVKNGE